MSTAVTRIEWHVTITREDGDDWPDYTYYDGHVFRPSVLRVTVIQQPWAPPQIYHADLHATRVRRDGSLGTSGIERSWAGEFITDPGYPEDMQPPAWAQDLALRVLAGITTTATEQESRSHA
jgi:hypothetical protein